MSEGIGPTCSICGRHQELPTLGPAFSERCDAAMHGWVGVWQGWFCPDHREQAPRDGEGVPR